MGQSAMEQNADYLRQAIELAYANAERGGRPFGAVVVKDGRIIARAVNEIIGTNDPTAHAEIIALTSAFNFLGSKYLPDASIYITVEPCLMCTGALYWSKIGKVVWGADDEKNGHKRITEPNWPFHPKTEVTKGILKEECAELMKSFFRSKR